MRKTNLNEPINQFLVKNRKRKPVSFHMPGHKYGNFGNSTAGSFDITEIPGADNIKKPSGIIKKSIENVSRIYGSKYSFYLTNGTTSGIHAVMHYAALNGKKIILSRDCHISAVNGAILFGVDVVYIPISYKNGLPRPAEHEAVEKSIDGNPDACGVLITSPNYYGRTAELARIAEAVHSKGMFMVVDEAHGSHFQFAGLSHLSGIKNGADIVCHSLHKTLPVYNQGAVLHVCSGRINHPQIEAAVNMLGTTSPSYPLLASMEKAVIHFQNNHGKLYRELKKNIGYLKSKLENNIEETDDFTRIVIKTPLSGFETTRILHERYNIDVEAADFQHIVCIATPYNKKRDFRRLAKALSDINIIGEKTDIPGNPGVSKRVVSIAKAYGKKTEMVPLDMAEGRICGTITVSYPPGTPLVCPGEIIDVYAINYINKVLNAGGTVLGIEDNKIPVLERT